MPLVSLPGWRWILKAENPRGQNRGVASEGIGGSLQPSARSDEIMRQRVWAVNEVVSGGDLEGSATHRDCPCRRAGAGCHGARRRADCRGAATPIRRTWLSRRGRGCCRGWILLVLLGLGRGAWVGEGVGASTRQSKA